MRFFQAFGSFFCFLAIAAAAVSSHVLYPSLSDPDIRAVQTSIFFALFHGLSLIVVPLSLKLTNKQTQILSILWMIGILGFSLSIFLLKLGISQAWQVFNWIGPITPFGGASLILSWLYLFFILFKKKS